MKKIIRGIATFISLIVLAIVGILGYAGFVPGVSHVFRADTPRDLGMPVSSGDLASGQLKLHQKLIETSAGVTAQSILGLGTTAINTTLTGQEWAAHVAAIHPAKDLQVKFSDDGGFEAAGRIDKDRILSAVQLLGYTNVTQAEVLSSARRYLPDGGAFYLKGSGKIVDNIVTLNLTKAEIGRFPIAPSGIQKALLEYAKVALERVPGLSISSMTIEHSQLKIEGAAPKQIPKF